MRKNKTMRVAVVLLALTLITSCFVGGTFAKYVTSTTGSDNARVAYWGFTEPANTTIDLFDDVYSTDVDSQNGANVIAPGTTKSATFKFAYTDNSGLTAPEVAYSFKVDATITGSYNELDDNPNFKWTLANPAGVITYYDDVSELLGAIKLLSGDASGTKEYAPGQLPKAFGTDDGQDNKNGNYTVGWFWAFDDTDTQYNKDAVFTAANNDSDDTAMGNAAALDNVILTITITATQIDK